LYHDAAAQLLVNLVLIKSSDGGGVKAAGHEEGDGEGGLGELPEAQTWVSLHLDRMALSFVQSHVPLVLPSF
jgi:hypothetical protein